MRRNCQAKPDLRLLTMKESRRFSNPASNHISDSATVRRSLTYASLTPSLAMDELCRKWPTIPVYFTKQSSRMRQRQAKPDLRQLDHRQSQTTLSGNRSQLRSLKRKGHVVHKALTMKESRQICQTQRV